jgi:hypothetical protein
LSHLPDLFNDVIQHPKGDVALQPELEESAGFGQVVRVQVDWEISLVQRVLAEVVDFNGYMHAQEQLVVNIEHAECGKNNAGL